MNNAKSLSAWLAAYLQNRGNYTGWEVSPKITLQGYFAAKGIIIDNSVFDFIIND
jgi:hypothetical protein